MATGRRDLLSEKRLALEEKGTDLTPLLLAPTVLHSAPKSLKPGSNFQILMDKLDGELPKKAAVTQAQHASVKFSPPGGDPVPGLRVGARHGNGSRKPRPGVGSQQLVRREVGSRSGPCT